MYPKWYLLNHSRIFLNLRNDTALTPTICLLSKDFLEFVIIVYYNLSLQSMYINTRVNGDIIASVLARMRLCSVCDGCEHIFPFAVIKIPSVLNGFQSICVSGKSLNIYIIYISSKLIIIVAPRFLLCAVRHLFLISHPISCKRIF